MEEQKSQHNQLGLSNKQELKSGRDYQELLATVWGRRRLLRVQGLAGTVKPWHQKLSSAGQHFLQKGKKASGKGTSSTYLEVPHLWEFSQP